MTLTADESAACTTIEATTVVLAKRIGAVEGGAGLRRGALAAVREAMHEAVRAERESVDESTPLAPAFRGYRLFRKWRTLSKELRCKLPPPRWNWIHVSLAAAVIAVQIVVHAQFPAHHVVEEYRLAVLTGSAALIVPVLPAIRFAELPERFTHVEQLTTWLVAMSPALYRGGTEWTVGQVGEVVDAVHRLRFREPSLRVLVSPQFLTAILALALFVTTALCIRDVMVAMVPVGPMPASLR